MFRPKELHKIPSQVDEAPIEYIAPDKNDYQAPQPIVNKQVELKPLEDTAYEGVKLNDLTEIGFQTISLLKVASNRIIDKSRFNIPLLDATPLKIIIQSLGGQQISENSFSVLNQEISLKENKWYNKTIRTGHVNAISLTKHLLAIEENVDERENQKTLFIAACKKITLLQDDVQNLKSISEQQESQPIQKEIVNPKVEEQKAVPVNNNSNNWGNKTIDWKALTEQLNSIPMSSIMEHVGADHTNRKGEWKVWATGHKVQVTGQQWKDWSGSGGVGGIAFLANHYSIINNIDDRNDENKKLLRKMAIKELMKEFGSDFDVSSLGGPIELNLKQPFSMPHVIDFKINDVRNYLHEKRGLPLWVINKQIATGNLFAGFPSDWKPNPHLKNPEKLQNEHVWAIFLAINGNAAEMRGIDRYDGYAKILATGSDKESGGFLIKAQKDCTERTVTALEASIDAMSYHAFYPGRVATSCMGVNFNLAVTSALEAFNAGYKFNLGFDNDLAGNEAAVKFKEQMIEELGPDEYQKNIDSDKLKYFDLAIKVLVQTMKNNETFYFDVRNNETGKEAFSMFQEQLLKVIPKEEIRTYLNKGKIKYLNVCPVFGMIQDPKLEAQQIVDLLDSGKPYYLRIRIDDDEKPEIRDKRIAFEEAMKNIAKDKIQTWEKEGKIIFKKEALAKDWNEFFLYMKTQPEFADTLRQQENHYSKINDIKKNPSP